MAFPYQAVHSSACDRANSGNVATSAITTDGKVFGR